MKTKEEYVLAGLIERAKGTELNVEMTQEEFSYLDEDDTKPAWRMRNANDTGWALLWHEGERWAFRSIRMLD